jgi:tetratricopeptide (TPR) repeat protein
MYFLSADGNYDETIQVLETTPESLWHPCAYETYIYRYYAEALKNRERRTDAVAVLIKAIDKKDKNPERNLLPLIRYWFKNPSLVTQFKAHPRYESIMRDMIASMGRDWKNADKGISDELHDFCIVNSFLEMKQGNNSLADLYMNTALAIAKASPDKKERIIHAQFYSDAMRYWRANFEKQKNTAYNLKFLCPYYRSIDADMERDGKKYRRTNTMSDDFISNIISENKDNSFAATVAYFYLFEGRILMSFDYQVVNATIREVNGRHMGYDMIDPNPGEMYFKAYNNYDGVMDFYDIEIPSQYLGGPSPLMFAPYSLYSTNWRFRTYMLTGASYSVYIHEIFHNIESYYKISPAHGYLTGNKKTWPAWFSSMASKEGVNAQLSYMKGRFEHDIMPKGIDVIRLRETARSNIPETAYYDFVKKSSAVPFAKVRESGQAFLAGQDLYGKKDYKGAAEQYRRAYAANPCNQRALRHLADVLYWKLNNKDEAVSLFKKYVENFEGLPFTEEAVNRILWNTFSEKRDYASIISLTDRYSKWVTGKEERTMMLFFRGASLCRTGKSAEAIPVLEEALKNDVVWQDNIKKELAVCRKK